MPHNMFQTHVYTHWNYIKGRQNIEIRLVSEDKLLKRSVSKQTYKMWAGKLLFIEQFQLQPVRRRTVKSY